MAAFEHAGLMTQIVANLYGLINNMRDNATGYKSQAEKPEADIAAIGSTMRADAAAYAARLGWVSALAQRNPQVFAGALALIEANPQDALSLHDKLLALCDHTLTVALTTQSEINAEADYIVSAAPNYERLW